MQLHGWRANVDLQIIIDYRICLEYITKYASKPEVKSPVSKKVLDTVLTNASVNSATNGTKIVRKLMIKSLGECDFSAQETMHQRFSLKLHSSSFTVTPVFLNACRRIRPNKSECLCVQSTYDSLLDSYASREKFVSFVPDIMMLNLTEFVTKYKVSSKKLVSQGPKYVPQFFPTCS